MKEISRAISQYQDTYGRLPAATVRGKDGRPLLSWRVLILPFLEGGSDLYKGFHFGSALYKEFHFDEPWDSPHNKPLLEKMPREYAPPIGLTDSAPRGSTFYQVFTGKATAFETDGLVMPKDFPDGLANTILLIEAGHAVPWTQPADLSYQADQPVPELGGLFKGPTRFSNWNQIAGMNVAFADRSVRFLKKPVDEGRLRGMITRNGGEPIMPED